MTQDPWSQFKEQIGDNPSPVVQQFIQDYEAAEQEARNLLNQQQQQEQEERSRDRQSK
ncbi:MAG: hypothetical protein MUC48_24685 [Leptolyngbya sp. Prado105]|jgi:hypothetical protein|nr:hypothetical protein [Leptolyngbya sp. Prado105]